METAPTPKDTVFREGTARLYRFRRPGPAKQNGEADAHPEQKKSGWREADPEAPPVLLVPSLINRWYILDLRSGASIVEALVQSGLRVYCLDWGVAEDEDRYFDWEAVFRRLGRAVRFVKRDAQAERVSLLGYCMGGTLCAIYAAQHQDELAGLVNLAGPIDFSKAGLLATMVDERWFDAKSIAAAGNINPLQMQSGFSALRPTLQLKKIASLWDTMTNEASKTAFLALESWASDNVPFPAAAYVTYIEELYQQNLLVESGHYVAGEPVDLEQISIPVLTIVAAKDTICPPAAAVALNELASATDNEVVTYPGGHVGAIVGGKAPETLYPRLSSWFQDRGRAPIERVPPDQPS